jgi:outer membrane protein, multidrug efflux system
VSARRVRGAVRMQTGVKRLAWLGFASLVGCATEPQLTRPQVALPAQFAPAGTPAAAAPSVIASQWWTLYGDAALNQTVAAALQNNTDLALAVARVDETAALLGLTRAAQWPSVELGASVTRSRQSTLNGLPVPPGGPQATTHRVALAPSFEIDLWGRLRHANAAARQQLLGAVYARDTVQLALTAGAAQLYFGIRSLDAQLLVNEAQARSRRCVRNAPNCSASARCWNTSGHNSPGSPVSRSPRGPRRRRRRRC